MPPAHGIGDIAVNGTSWRCFRFVFDPGWTGLLDDFDKGVNRGLELPFCGLDDAPATARCWLAFWGWRHGEVVERIMDTFVGLLKIF
jgi:hypothetical protein